MASSTIAGQAGTAGSIGGGATPLTFPDFEPHHGEVRSQVQILGTGLASVTLVQFNGVDATILPGGSDSAIKVTVPDLATTGPITISDGTTRITSMDSFMVDPSRPELDTVTPAAATPGTTLKLTGRHLLNLTSVVFDAANGSFNGTPVALMPKSFKVVVPQGAGPGDARIVVMTPLGRASIKFRVKR